MKRLLIIITFAIYACGVFAQQESRQQDKQITLESLKGTFEIKATVRNYMLPSDIVKIITDNRSANKRVVKQLSPEVQLVIYPLSEIQSSGKGRD